MISVLITWRAVGQLTENNAFITESAAASLPLKSWVEYALPLLLLSYTIPLFCAESVQTYSIYSLSLSHLQCPQSGLITQITQKQLRITYCYFIFLLKVLCFFFFLRGKRALWGILPPGRFLPVLCSMQLRCTAFLGLCLPGFFISFSSPILTGAKSNAFPVLNQSTLKHSLVCGPHSLKISLLFQTACFPPSITTVPSLRDILFLPVKIILYFIFFIICYSRVKVLWKVEESNGYLRDVIFNNPFSWEEKMVSLSNLLRIAVFTKQPFCWSYPWSFITIQDYGEAHNST